MYNRRDSRRVTRQCPVAYQFGGVVAQGVTLNVSENGARVLFRHPVGNHVAVTLQLDHDVSVHAETVWEQPLRGGSCIRGLRFVTDTCRPELSRWVNRQSVGADTATVYAHASGEWV